MLRIGMVGWFICDHHDKFPPAEDKCGKAAKIVAGIPTDASKPYPIRILFNNPMLGFLDIRADEFTQDETKLIFHLLACKGKTP